MTNKELSPQQKSLIKMYAQRAKLPPGLVQQWVEENKVSITELKMWVLGLSVPQAYQERQVACWKDCWDSS